LNGPQAIQWKRAMSLESDSIRKNGAIKLVDRSPNMNIIDSKWIFRIKNEASGNVRYKARLVIHGFKHKRQYHRFET